MKELNFHQGFKSKIKENLNIGMKHGIVVNALKTTVWVNDFTILNSNCRSKIKRKISESVFIIRSKKLTLNAKETSIKLNLFN